jgi:hypothetical protein
MIVVQQLQTCYTSMPIQNEYLYPTRVRHLAIYVYIRLMVVVFECHAILHSMIIIIP